MAFIAGLIWGVVIAGLQVASEHYGPSLGPIALNGNGALAVPATLIPLAIFWGWTWIANRWSGRSLIPGIVFVAGLWLGTGAAAPIDVLLYPQSPDATLVSSLPGLLLSGAIFVLPLALIAAGVYWALRSDRLPAAGLIVFLLYAIGLALSIVPLLGPIIGGGVIAGTAAGQVWRRAGGHTLIGIFVLVLMLIAVYGVPYVQAGGALPRLSG